MTRSTVVVAAILAGAFLFLLGAALRNASTPAATTMPPSDETGWQW